MIPFDFAYYKPDSKLEAVQMWQTLIDEEKTVVYYCGGTEFITFARLNKLIADAVIDLKGIPECQAMELWEDQLAIGSAVSLNKIAEAKLFPLLGETVKGIADHTSRNKITLGGNLNSQLMYREGILPLLLTDAAVKITGNDGDKIVTIKELYDRDWKLNPGEFIVQVIIRKEYTHLPFVSLKKTKCSKIGYPIVTIAALKKDQVIRAAISGVCEYPFRSAELEAILNDPSLSIEERVEKAAGKVPGLIIDDLQASREYREFVLKNTLLETLETLEAAQ